MHDIIAIYLAYQPFILIAAGCLAVCAVYETFFMEG